MRRGSGNRLRRYSSRRWLRRPAVLRPFTPAKSPIISPFAAENSRFDVMTYTIAARNTSAVLPIAVAPIPPPGKAKESDLTIRYEDPFKRGFEYVPTPTTVCISRFARTPRLPPGKPWIPVH